MGNTEDVKAWLVSIIIKSSNSHTSETTESTTRLGRKSVCRPVQQETMLPLECVCVVCVWVVCVCGGCGWCVHSAGAVFFPPRQSADIHSATAVFLCDSTEIPSVIGIDLTGFGSVTASPLNPDQPLLLSKLLSDTYTHTHTHIHTHTYTLTYNRLSVRQA